MVTVCIKPKKLTARAASSWTYSVSPQLPQRETAAGSGGIFPQIADGDFNRSVLQMDRQAIKPFCTARADKRRIPGISIVTKS